MGTLSKLLATAEGGTIDNSLPGWKTYIEDHLDYVMVRSTTYSIDAPLMNLYRYDLKRFLKAYLNRQEDIAWIVLRLNDLSNDNEFFKPGNYIIPKDDDILRLYHTFQTINANAA